MSWEGDEIARLKSRVEQLETEALEWRDTAILREDERDQVTRERDELGEAARRNAQAAAEWEREWSRAVKRENEARQLAVHAVARWRLLQALGHPPGCGPDAAELRQLVAAHRWLAQPPQQPRCALCGQPKPALDPAGVCPACRVGRVEPPAEE